MPLPPTDWLQGYVNDNVPLSAAIGEARREGYAFTDQLFRQRYRALGARPQLALGTRHGNTLLDEAQVRAIRRAHGAFTYVALAKQYAVSPDTIYNIRHRRTWGWLEDGP